MGYSQARLILEEKAKLYDKLSHDKSLLSEDIISEERSLFLVDFQQKVVDRTKRTLDDEDEAYAAKEEGEEW